MFYGGRQIRMRSQNINKQKDSNNESGYEEYSVKDEVPSYFNIYECGGNILNRLDADYEQACMATMKYKYYTKILETLVDYNDRNNAPLSNENIRQSVSRVMAETEEEERDARRNSNNVTMYTFFNQSPVPINTQRKNANVTNERRISSNILAETIKEVNGLTIQ